ncbi:MAG: alcohol dehydrogenase catalytic domain-containing protein, partial [Phycisphaerae bacterium]
MPTILAAVMPGPDRPVEVREIPSPELEPDSALLAVELSEVCGTDVHLLHGRLAGVPYPIVPGHVSIGRLEKIRGTLVDTAGKPFVEGDRLLVGHNVAFDMVVAAYKWPDLLPAIFAKYERDQVTDTLLRQKLIDIASFRRVRTRYALANLAKRWFTIEMDKDTWRLHYDELYDV